jgi:PilZ domain
LSLFGHVMEDVRGEQRRRTLKAGSIAFGGGAIDCTVRNLSSRGACLEVTSQQGIPEFFVLAIEGDEIKLPCSIAWRKGRKMGVVFKLKLD